MLVVFCFEINAVLFYNLKNLETSLNFQTSGTTLAVIYDRFNQLFHLLWDVLSIRVAFPSNHLHRHTDPGHG